ncbi:lytic transglycosylase domain-containing protein [Cupriavidus plantarum]|uniref:lytic transglycosylase domain-containing protein n=1 Tax=Cupriavidus plantarum TaxID=942865 RepID=UPI000E282FE3|nr:lytic transglycosylase domain-containing protein [Cupriavidus plantarum]NYI00735.1 soluble lytic murein transglycosylase-like protein [Cupriavidus plantarum]REE93591.1 transglycosylase-like protein with SLT domain [Cupriavidus plantarum]RLK39013.1 transglycosylase-like protein with SLT domain [Cupriavidus plantarum]CAG2135884.1 Membrane-bound lytic murein transglycosylase F [Cupriavidus plantarum]SMR84656.1 Transglycosylase SLT domain-containing protein [Cupriavidus plantarum]
MSIFTLRRLLGRLLATAIAATVGLALAALLMPASAWAMLVCTDPGGATLYASQRVQGMVCRRVPGIDVAVTVRREPAQPYGLRPLDTASYAREIDAVAREYGIDAATVRAIIHVESAFNPRAVSRAGAQGLMQLMPGTALRFGVRDAFDSTDNIRGGVRYYAWLLARFSGSVDLALAGFNAGEAAVERYGGIPPYAETQRYVSAVRQMIARYRLAASASGRLGDANLRQQLLEFRHT